jgi:hypothetical protein
VPLYKLERWRQKAEAALDGALKERETDAVSDELATAMRRVGELSMEVELLRPVSSTPALWFAGGRGDSGKDLPDHRPPLRHRPGLPGLGRAAVVLLC